MKCKDGGIRGARARGRNDYGSGSVTWSRPRRRGLWSPLQEKPTTHVEHHAEDLFDLFSRFLTTLKTSPPALRMSASINSNAIAQFYLFYTVAKIDKDRHK
jgi:hypothetical protein